MSAVDPIGVEVRSVEEGLQARLTEDGTFLVKCLGSCKDEGRTNHVVGVGAASKPDAWHLHLTCDCPSGVARPRESVPCLHSATVARRLERMGWVLWQGGAWVLVGEGLEALAKVAPEKAATKCRGKCPICGKGVSFLLTHDETRFPKAIASEHNEACRQAYAEKAAKAALAHPDLIDLWARDEA